MTKPLKQVSRRLAGLPWCAILVGWFTHEDRAQSSNVFHPPSGGATFCSARCQLAHLHDYQRHVDAGL
jgi:hypothetical protein